MFPPFGAGHQGRQDDGKATDPRGPTVSVVAAATTALTLCAPLANADDSGQKNGRFTAGAPGVGDVYYPLAGNGGYDVEHYDITGTYDPATDVWSATTVDLRHGDRRPLPVRPRLRRDDDHRPRRRWQAGRLVPRRGRARRRAAAQDQVAALRSRSARPTPVSRRSSSSHWGDFDLRTGFMATDDGATVAGQPDVAAGWFPVNDHPRDKAAYDFHVTVPRRARRRRQRFPRERATTAGGWHDRFDWHAPEPMASYLATIDIGEWDVRRVDHGESGLPVYDAVDPDLLADPVLGPSIDASLARQGEIVDVLSSAFGPYPFSTVGAIVDDQDDLFFALETQTRPVYSKYFWPDGGDSVVAHELAHQWYGDHVALEQWQDIWLNEGWATYAEWIWGEHEGFFTPQDAFDFYYYEIPATTTRSGRSSSASRRTTTSSATRSTSGARMTLQVLRNRVGDDAFWQIARHWVQEQGGGTGTTAQFIDAVRASLGAAARRPVRRVAVHRIQAHAGNSRCALNGGAAGPLRGARVGRPIQQATVRWAVLSQTRPLPRPPLPRPRPVPAGESRPG